VSSRQSGEAWVIIETRNQEFAVSASHVREVVVMPEITSLPCCPSQHRGVINLRGRILPLVDMRKQFGWQSVPEEQEEFYKLMGQREQDHRNWLEALEKSVAEGAEFRLARDPRQCAFGQWYYSYRSESPWITALLRKFEGPHGKIHALASSIDQLTRNGENAEAMRLIENARQGVLREMVSLFQDLKKLMRETVKELAMVIATDRGGFAVSIDRVVGVERIPADRIEELHTGSALFDGRHVHRAAKRGAKGALAMILEVGLFMPASSH
jgi:purine-binding chemotaxis protein CheW